MGNQHQAVCSWSHGSKNCEEIILSWGVAPPGNAVGLGLVVVKITMVVVVVVVVVQSVVMMQIVIGNSDI